jgi:hypothetical protein
MSSFSRLFRIAAVALALGVVPVLAGCSGLKPVYGDVRIGGQQAVELRYESPQNRLEQIIYQDLALRLGKSSGNVPMVRVTASQSSVSLAAKAAGMEPQQMRVTASVVVTAPDGQVLLSRSRTQTADYTTGPQSLSNRQAAADAAERAARLLADTLRLEILAALAS